MKQKKELLFLLTVMYRGGVYHKLGIVAAPSLAAAARMLGVGIEGRMDKWDGRGAYYIKQGAPEEPLYILEHWEKLRTFPAAEIKRHNLKIGKAKNRSR